MSTQMKLNDNLVNVNVNKNCKEEVIALLCELLQEQNCIKDTFQNAVLEREKVYPTGLPLNQLGVAIPHTDVEHVVDPAIAVAVLSNPVQFQMMGDPDTDVSVNIVFVLAVKEPKQQLELLENLMSIFQSDDVMDQLKNAASASEVVSIMERELKIDHVSNTHLS